jgi:hypothetical protein
MLNQFRADKYFFLKYYLINLLIYSVACVVLALTTNLVSGGYGWIWFLVLVPVILPDFMVITLGGILCAAFLVYSGTFYWWYLLGIPLGRLSWSAIGYAHAQCVAWKSSTEVVESRLR